MANVIIDDANLRNIANAIREKSGSTDTYKPSDMPQAILDIISGGGSLYTSITYKDDDTIILVDKDGTEHEMVCTYVDDVLKNITYDGKKIRIGYEGEGLKNVGSTAVYLEDAFGDDSESEARDLLTVSFVVDDELYESVSVKSGNSIYPPAVSPYEKGYNFSHWSYNNDYMPIPFTPTTDTTITAVMDDIIDAVYKKYGISRDEYPDFILMCRSTTTTQEWILYIAQEGAFSVSVRTADGSCDIYTSSDKPNYYTVPTNSYNGLDPTECLEASVNYLYSSPHFDTTRLSRNCLVSGNYIFYTNTRLTCDSGEWNSFG